MIGPPGTGKTMLARRMVTILPRMTLEEALETTKIHSVAGILPAGDSLLGIRPFRSPHHTISDAGIIGGGHVPRPGDDRPGKNNPDLSRALHARRGHFTDPHHECRCTPTAIQRYHSKISGPLLDRIDIHIEVPALKYDELKSTTAGEYNVKSIKVYACPRGKKNRPALPEKCRAA